MKSKQDNSNDVIVMMLGYLCVSTEIESSLSRKVEILDKFDIVDGKIAKICGVSVQSVRDARMRLKRTKKK